MSPIPCIKLNDGNIIPTLSYGLGTVHFMGQEKDVSEMTTMALHNGYYHLDCAEAYGNEAAVGAGIKAAKIPRERLFVTTKVVGPKDQDVEAALSASLSNLGLNYVDLYLVHVPFSAGSPEGLQKVWLQMEALKNAGKARSIGVSNFERHDLENIMQVATITPAINQIELHPYSQHKGLLEFHGQHNIVTAAYSPLSAITAARPGPVDEIHAKLANKYGVTESEVALRWVLDQGMIAVTTSKNPQRLQGYSKRLFTFELSNEEIQDILELGAQKSYTGITTKFMGDKYGSYRSS